MAITSGQKGKIAMKRIGTLGILCIAGIIVQGDDFPEKNNNPSGFYSDSENDLEKNLLVKQSEKDPFFLTSGMIS
jgi:hypothetical protein